jgi:Cu+-exporting ATPase
MAKDPVCGMTVELSSAAAERLYEGKTFYFCARGCAEAFGKDPKKYLGNREASAGSRGSGAKPPTAAKSGASPSAPSGQAGDPGGKRQPPLFELKTPKSAFLRQPPVKAATAPETRPALAPAVSRLSLAVEGMHCASCVSTIEEALTAVTGVSEASVNLATGRALVSGKGLNPRRLVEAVRETGYEAKLASEEQPGATEAEDRSSREMRRILWRTLFAAALTLPVLVISMAGIQFARRDVFLLFLTLPVYLYAGWPFLSGMIRTLQHRTANMDTLVGLGTTAAFFLSAASTLFPRAVRRRGGRARLLRSRRRHRDPHPGRAVSGNPGAREDFGSHSQTPRPRAQEGPPAARRRRAGSPARGSRRGRSLARQARRRGARGRQGEVGRLLGGRVAGDW